jgi:exo-beta-1,3-glucanase (GH17 family)
MMINFWLFINRKVKNINIYKVFNLFIFIQITNSISLTSCTTMKKEIQIKHASEILGNPNYQAISYGGYRTNSRRVQPTKEQIKQDLKILSAMNIKVLRTYNVHLPEAINILKVIREMKNEDSSFEMYVMLGAWIDCKNAWTGFEPNHWEESERNAAEIQHAIELTNEYPDIIKVISVGNEAMVKWATAYFVQPSVILKWCTYLQELKMSGKLPKEVWITSSDNFASWGGGNSEYHNEDLNKLIKTVDYLSIHTYPMHDTHYNPVFWGILPEAAELTKDKKIYNSMKRSIGYAKNQYEAVKKYMESLGVKKPIHIGETDWSSYSNELYGINDSKATDEYKSGIFYKLMREWTDKDKISCFYFEAFDEPWKDAGNSGGSENHFGLFTVDGNAKYAVWDFVDKNVFKGLTRDRNPIIKTYNGNIDSLKNEVLLPPEKFVLEHVN